VAPWTVLRHTMKRETQTHSTLTQTHSTYLVCVKGAASSSLCSPSLRVDLVRCPLPFFTIAFFT
jgi:hypothetical protein